MLDLTLSGADLVLLGGLLFASAVGRAMRCETVTGLYVVAVLAGGASVSAVYVVPLLMMAIKWFRIPGG